VVRMVQRSEAYAAGVRPGDIVTSFNSVTIEDGQHLLRLVSDAKIGTTVSLGLLREGKRLTVKVPIVKSEPQERRRYR
jgi:S1-C subfamily serine protease